MADYNCEACEELRQEVPQLVVNGFDSDMCTSLKNDTGLATSSGHNDCTDLNNLNDCLIGNETDEVDLYEVCDWKTFMKSHLENLWTTLKAVICAICGIWTNIHKLWTAVKRLDCLVDYLFQGASFSFGETSSDTNSYIVCGKGVSFSNVSASGTASDVSLTYIAGGLAKLSGSLMLYTSSFTDRISSYNYDHNGVNPTKSTSRQGNADLNDTNTKPGGFSSQLLYEVRIKKSEFPQIKSIHSGFGMNSGGGGYHIDVTVHSAGKYASGQYGSCNSNTGAPAGTGYSTGHLVPDGWIYVQCRLTWIDRMHVAEDGTQYSPTCMLGIRMNQDEITC